MPGVFYGEFLGTVGMELEGIGLTKNFVETSMLSYIATEYPAIANKITFTNDASTNFKAMGINIGERNVLWLSEHTKEASSSFFQERKCTAQVMGYEIITHPQTIPELEKLMYPLMATLTQFGDFISDRAAIHFHVGFCNNLHFLQNMLSIGLYVDPVLFRLGGMGRTFRGRINNSAYARPLLNSVAAYTSPVGNARYVRVINPMKALEAKTTEEFWASFGVKYSTNGVGKYHPSRYAGINFYAVPQHGTIEWRHTNQTHDTYMLMAIGKFLRGITELSISINKRELSSLEVVPSNNEISVADGVEIISHLYALCREKELENLPSDEEIGDICALLETSHFQDIPETPVLTHLTSESANAISRDVAKMGKLEYIEKVIPPNHVDIHTIGYISMYDKLNLVHPPKPHNSEEEPEEDWTPEEEEI